MSDPIQITIYVNSNDNRPRVFRLPPASWGHPKTFWEVFATIYPRTYRLAEYLAELGEIKLASEVLLHPELFV